MRRWLVTLLVLPAAIHAGSLPHFDVEGSWEAPKEPGGDGAVAVRFFPRDPDLRLNETPAPRLALDLLEPVLVDRQGPPPREVPDYDPQTAQYLDLAQPVRFPVALSDGAPKGAHDVQAKVVYFYCSVREAWCRRGAAAVAFTVSVP